MKKQTKSLFLLLLTAMIWGFAFVAQLIGADYVGTFTFNASRFLLGGLSLIPVILIFERKADDRKKIKTTIFSGVIAGVILCTASALQQFGIEMTGSAGKAGFITGLYMVLVPIINLFFKKKTSFNTWCGALVALAGLYLLSFADGISAVGVGDLVLLIGSVMWAFHIIVIDKFGNEIYSLRFAMTQFLISASISFICALIFEDISFSAVVDAGFPILYAGFMSVGIAYTCQIIGQKNADPTIASIVLSTESVFSAVGEALFFGFIYTSYTGYKPMTLHGYIGCLIMFAGIIITQIKFKFPSLSQSSL